ncbi:unnamed protein product [Fusarium venenatum]|uniref:Uncharacterized protein n=1 Tax=Fusarium venenatum TaxID=56646 RepID=A0A2L2SYQ5_9HYPO|nr:uncharacterized protein FVRRES_06584 [Fusarium venenatum]CEI62148.1 unnamed protein product [Fusarium venenatum]
MYRQIYIQGFGCSLTSPLIDDSGSKGFRDSLSVRVTLALTEALRPPPRARLLTELKFISGNANEFSGDHLKLEHGDQRSKRKASFSSLTDLTLGAFINVATKHC